MVRGLVSLHHEKSIVHRDLKPENLLVNHRGEIKITDFGVSAILESSAGQRGTFIGTCHYMSVSLCVSQSLSVSLSLSPSPTCCCDFSVYSHVLRINGPHNIFFVSQKE